MINRPPMYFYDLDFVLLACIRGDRLYTPAGKHIGWVNLELEVFDKDEEKDGPIGQFQKWSSFSGLPGQWKWLYNFAVIEQDEPLSPSFPIKPSTKIWMSKLPPSDIAGLVRQMERNHP